MKKMLCCKVKKYRIVEQCLKGQIQLVVWFSKCTKESTYSLFFIHPNTLLSC